MPLLKATLSPGATSAHRGVRLALAGALAGMFTNTLLHPLDTVKTLRQTNPSLYRGVAPAICTIIQSRGPLALYAGIAPALVGSALSSALYFGVYELAKARLARLSPPVFRAPRTRVPATALAAACGNVASSILFVPKEVVKQRMQAGLHAGTFFTAALAVVRASGMQGLYRGYKATLLRNIPSTMIRFAVYEEAKLALARSKAGGAADVTAAEFVAAGAVAGVVSSACTTPMDVVKTRFATGAIAPGTGIPGALGAIMKEQGVSGLFMGLRPRLVWSALFAAVGFTSYEVCKGWMLGLKADLERDKVSQGPVRGWGTEERKGVEMVTSKRYARSSSVCARTALPRGANIPWCTSRNELRIL